MQYFTIAATILSASLMANAAPTTSSAPLERRACSVAYPESIGFPINYDIHQDANRANSREAFVNFNSVPAGSYGCQLEVNFPAGYPIQNSGNSLVNVYAVKPDNTQTLFGTVRFQSSPVAPTKYVINSAACAQTMNYKMAIASDKDAGRVAFADVINAGITMTYNC